MVYAYNFTDVDDKILSRAGKENKTMKEIANKYIFEFKKDFQTLKLKKHDHNPQATQFIPEMITLIKTLLHNEKAYIVDQDVFYSVKQFPNYGKLSRRKGDELFSGARVEVDERKKDPRDFALWKSCKTEKEPGWHSPWGRGRPGWHIECTCMIFSLLGNNIDIHGGGTDLIFPHHENELAQAEGAKKGPFVKYWVHNNMFTFGGEKMAKSTGNVSIMRTFLTEYNGEIFKYLVLSSHYRSITEVSENKILQCIQALSRIYSFLLKADSMEHALSYDISFENKHIDTKSTESASSSTSNEKEINIDRNTISSEIKSAQKTIENHLDDDLNTPAALSTLFTLIRRFNEKNNASPADTKKIFLYAREIKNTIIKYGKIMGLFQESPIEFLTDIDNIFIKRNKLNKEKINQLVEERSQARKNRNFKKADEIRKQLTDMNIEVKDSPAGTTWETKKTFNKN